MDFSCVEEKKTYEQVLKLRYQISQLPKNQSRDELLEQLRLAEVSLEQYEPILKENPQRHVMFPIKFPEVWKAYKRHEASIWTAAEVTLNDDLLQWNNQENQNALNDLSENDKFFIKHVLAFFASADGIVNENLAMRFYGQVQIPEARAFYGMQIAIENVHSEVYSMLIDQLVSNNEEKEKLFEAVKNYPSVTKLAEWALKWATSTQPFNRRLIAFACVEAILFSGPFCAIYWLKKRGLMPGLTFSNELISRDEAQHSDFAVLLNSMLKYPAEDEVIMEIMNEALALEKEFINESLPCKLIGMNAESMGTYVQYVGNYLAQQLNCPLFTPVENPFDWMEMMSLKSVTNFFEKRVGNYNKAGITEDTVNNGHNENNDADILEDF